MHTLPQPEFMYFPERSHSNRVPARATCFFLIVKIMAARSGINNSGEKSVILEKGLASDDIMQPVCGRALS